MHESPTDDDLAASGRTREELKRIAAERPWCIYAAIDAMTDAEYQEFVDLAMNCTSKAAASDGKPIPVRE